MGKQVDKSKLGGANGLSFVIPVPVVVTKDNFQEVFTTPVRRTSRRPTCWTGS